MTKVPSMRCPLASPLVFWARWVISGLARWIRVKRTDMSDVLLHEAPDGERDGNDRLERPVDRRGGPSKTRNG
jgi:hypothetical protein